MGSKSHRDQSERLSLKLFTPGDADELFACITPAITRFMQWEPPRSPVAFAAVWRSWLEPILDGSNLHFLVRRSQDGRCLGLVGLHAAKTVSPELGIWLREDAQGQVSAGRPSPLSLHGRRRNSRRTALNILSRKKHRQQKDCRTPRRIDSRTPVQFKIRRSRLPYSQTLTLTR
ncbi:GNAT family N-acetyltransferase [Mesorhizobium captivum]|uniref:GNAT family N-acetyltransferase n=1 Tax=Mesorhizobium captivum TaxID=3072319 RepID=UPI002A2436E7|nr:GNAT family N-acetyltransferase [Mesorhizobium sp. VK3C]MDX8447374.1 GNAT family N-acetyltransferase [Mesorhizobium sp. VK3C]